MNQNNDGPTRRGFICRSALGAGALVVAGQTALFKVAVAGEKAPAEFTMIAVDYLKCAGCRTCETVCSAHNNKVEIDGEMLNGLGNPNLSNITVYNYNPDVDVPAVCAMCPDAPCIEYCPVEPDEKTGLRPLYRDPKTGAIKLRPELCIGCGGCADECKSGVIALNPDTEKPEHMCKLCDGDPQCVKHCPYGALTHVKVDPRRELYAKRADEIAEALTRKWYPGVK